MHKPVTEDEVTSLHDLSAVDLIAGHADDMRRSIQNIRTGSILKLTPQKVKEAQR